MSTNLSFNNIDQVRHLLFFKKWILSDFNLQIYSRNLNNETNLNFRLINCLNDLLFSKKQLFM